MRISHRPEWQRTLCVFKSFCHIMWMFCIRTVCSGANIEKHCEFIDPWVILLLNFNTLNSEGPQSKEIAHPIWKKKFLALQFSKETFNFTQSWLQKTWNIVYKLYRLYIYATVLDADWFYEKKKTKPVHEVLAEQL